MAGAKACLGHGVGERGARKNKISKLLTSPLPSLDANLRVLIKKGPVSEETSLKEVEEMCSSKPEWRVIENGNKAENQLTKDLDILKALS